MLKISKAATDLRPRLTVEGKLIGPWASELKSACDKARTDQQGGDVLVELVDLTAISQEAENVILELMREGVKFIPHGAFSKVVLRQITSRLRASSKKATLAS